jgi:hypothetical protein
VSCLLRNIEHGIARCKLVVPWWITDKKQRGINDANSIFDDNKENINRAGRILGDLTVVQALMRNLNPGESRSKLCQKALKGLNSKAYMSCDPKLSIALNQLSDKM